jgi:hypothetical protein
MGDCIEHHRAANTLMNPVREQQNQTARLSTWLKDLRRAVRANHFKEAQEQRLVLAGAGRVSKSPFVLT